VEDGIIGEMFEHTFDIIPKYITAIYNAFFPKKVYLKLWKTAKLLTISKAGQGKTEEISDFRSLCLPNTGENALEILLINRIKHHIFPATS